MIYAQSTGARDPVWKIMVGTLLRGLLYGSLLFATGVLGRPLRPSPKGQGLQNPATWIAEGARISVDNCGHGGEECLFDLDVDEFESVAGTGSAIVTVPTINQNILAWTDSFASAIRCGQSITFVIGTEIFTASRQEGANQSACDVTRGRYSWRGIINGSKGDLTCRFSRGALDINIRVMDDTIDSFYRVTMVEADVAVKRILKTDVPEFKGGDRRRALGDIEIPTRRLRGRRLVETTGGAARGTDLVVFYTHSAVISAGGSRILESEIEEKLEDYNIAVDALTYTHLGVNLVAMIAISSSDYSFITPILASASAEDQLYNFPATPDLVAWRDYVGADAMLLVHGWGIASDLCGIDYSPGSTTFVRSVGPMIHRSCSMSSVITLAYFANEHCPGV